MDYLETITFTELMKDYVPLPRPENAPPLTLSQIISIEPRIAGILAALKPCRRDRDYYFRYCEAKEKLSDLVGWQAEQYALRTCQAYDVVLDTVIDKLNG